MNVNSSAAEGGGSLGPSLAEEDEVLGPGGSAGMGNADDGGPREGMSDGGGGYGWPDGGYNDCDGGRRGVDVKDCSPAEYM